ncbi:MAG: TraR/DksA C4-type zinc finger protein [Candidatus Dechloromonas phosphoritropha]
MSDEIDRAQDREEEMRSDALARMARRADCMAALPAAEFCAVCEDPIPAPRRSAVHGVQTCIECQRDLERAGYGTGF